MISEASCSHTVNKIYFSDIIDIIIDILEWYNACLGHTLLYVYCTISNICRFGEAGKRRAGRFVQRPILRPARLPQAVPTTRPIHVVDSVASSEQEVSASYISSLPLVNIENIDL
jgi:hypothetical protein